MTKLTRPTKTMWVLFALLIIFSVLLAYFVLSFKIEKTIKVQFFINDKRELVLIAPEKTLFFLEKNKQVNVNYSDRFYMLKIFKIQKINENVLVSFYKIPPEMKLVPNTHIDGSLFYEKTSVLKALFPY
ncbi:hypothetical protein E1I18_01175 [Mycoplasmopsis mucosicanis]|uniref:Uncharacterized protein n=1 Tax=Mycoplasmopsis mucosicanis TaxID=458208 RepID=A0A507SV36_9BACT|nr:hypothetical protein [Mycoplasmopsis mucosicanis]TQC54054.1 hypothetical protein E1I18_01175 [Mycoplasmopsis mucosicanis]